MAHWEGMLTKVRVQGFKAILDTKSLELSPLTVFLGRNGSGKSSLLESLQWLQECLWFGTQAATQNRFISFANLINRRAERISLDLEFSQIRYSIEVGQPRPKEIHSVLKECCRVEGSGAEREEISTGAKYLRQINGGVSVGDRDKLALSKVKIPGYKSKGAAEVLDFFRRAVFLRLNPTQIARQGPLTRPDDGPLLDEHGNNLPALLRSLTPKQRKQVVGGIQEALKGCAKIEKVGVIENDLSQSGTMAIEEVIRSKEGSKTYKLPALVLSEGTRRLAAIYALLAIEPRPSLIAIEEIENGLDPWTLNLVLDALKRAAVEGVQIMLTTHSPYFLDKLDADQIFHVSRRQGESRYCRITEYREVAEYEGMVPPGVMYLSDYFRQGKKGSE